MRSLRRYPWVGKPTELRHDGELLGGVDDAVVGAVESLIAHAVRVEVTAVLVTDAAVAVVTISTVIALTADLANGLFTISNGSWQLLDTK